MRRIVPFLICLFVGIGIGWYFGYTRPSAKNERELLAQYHYVRDNFHMTDAEMAEAGPKIPQYFEDVKRQDEMAAIVSLAAIKRLEGGYTNEAEHILLHVVGGYYRAYHAKGGDSNTLAHIESMAQKYPAVAAEISRKIE